MGGKQMKFREESLREFEELTPFNRAEISHAFIRFRDLYNLFYQQPESSDSPHHILDNHGFANPHASLPVAFIMDELPELSSNPFRYRICRAFCISDNGQMNFMEFLDMVSSFSPKADLEKKIHHAFQIFDIDGDGLLSRNDLYAMMNMMTGVDNEPLTHPEEKAEWERVQQWIVDGVFYECNKRETVRTKSPTAPTAAAATGNDVVQIALTPVGDEEQLQDDEADDLACDSKECLTIEDFRYCVHRSPDFKNIFSFKI